MEGGGGTAPNSRGGTASENVRERPEGGGKKRTDEVGTIRSKPRNNSKEREKYLSKKRSGGLGGRLGKVAELVEKEVGEPSVADGEVSQLAGRSQAWGGVNLEPLKKKLNPKPCEKGERKRD